MKDKGVIQILCEEINATYTKEMESAGVLGAFVSVIVGEIDEMVAIDQHLTKFGGDVVSTEAVNALEAVKKLLIFSTDREQLIKRADKAHMLTYVPDEGPCDHYIDMLSSCVSAIRFGLEAPCRSRHAAEAANHVWRYRYGITLLDRHSNGWGKKWARSKFYEALGNLSS